VRGKDLSAVTIDAKLGANSNGAKSLFKWAALFVSEPCSFFFLLPLGFLSHHFALPHESVFFTMKTWIWSIDLWEQGILSPLLVFFRINLICISRIFELKNRHYLFIHLLKFVCIIHP
jgi:hypothetical protein